MNFRTTYILLGAVGVALVALAGYVIFSGDSDKPPPSVEGYVLKALKAANVKAEDVTSVEIERPGQTPDRIAFIREGRAWQMVAPGRARVDGPAVEGLVNGLLNAKTEKSADLSPNPAAHGLDSPPVKVTLKTDKLAETLNLGNVTVGGDRGVVYVTTSDAPDRPQAARRSDLSALFKADAKGATNAGQLVKGVPDFRPLKLIGDGVLDPVNQVRSFAVRAGKDEIALHRPLPAGAWTFRIPADYGEAAGDAAPAFGDPKGPAPGINSVGQLLNTITSIQPATKAQVIEEPGDLKQYGLDPSQNPMQIDFSRDDGVKETIFVSDPVKAADGSEKYYARNETDTVVAEVPAEHVKKVRAALAAKSLLRDRTVLKVQPARVDAIDVTANGETIELRRVGLGWKVYGSDGSDRPARAQAITDLLSRLTAPQLATGFPPPGVPDAKSGLDKPAVEVKLWEGGIVKEEKADPNAKPKVSPTPSARLLFGHKDVGNVVHARRMVGDAKADFLIPQDAYDLAARGRLDYVDATLKPFGADAVLKLSFPHGKDTYELERPDDGKPAAQAVWTIKNPPSLASRTADPGKVADLINQLSFLRANKVVADKPTPEVLNRLRVNPADPRLSVKFTVKDQGERTYLFGEDVGTEKRQVYLKPADQELVFEVDRGAFDLFGKADVQDTVVHRRDKTKVQALKITGWQEVLGSPTTLELERKEGKWVVKAGGMYELDAGKLDSLLGDLTTLKADTFVVLKEGPKPEHNLDVAKNALSFEMTVEGDKGPVTVVVSPPNKDGKVFATSSLAAGDVFTMPDRFAALRAKPAALKKD